MTLDPAFQLTSINGAAFKLPPSSPGGEPVPLTLGAVLIEAALAPKMRQAAHGLEPEPQNAMQIVRRDLLARKIFSATGAAQKITLKTDEVIFLKDRLPLLEAQRGFHVSAIAAALMLLCPGDFSTEEERP